MKSILNGNGIYYVFSFKLKAIEIGKEIFYVDVSVAFIYFYYGFFRCYRLVAILMSGCKMRNVHVMYMFFRKEYFNYKTDTNMFSVL